LAPCYLTMADLTQFGSRVPSCTVQYIPPCSQSSLIMANEQRTDSQERDTDLLVGAELSGYGITYIIDVHIAAIDSIV
jgi:hypothetical protein